jgi:hypothetical protein
MNELLADIKARLLNGEYKNEEHVRLSLVARVLQILGWNIWNPMEVNAEFVVVPNEDNKKGDVALFLRPFVPSVFVEIKAVGQMQGKLTVIEQQMRKLVDCAVKTALKNGVPLQDVRAVANLEQGDVNERGFHRIRDTAYSVQGMDAKSSWKASLHLAKKTNLDIQVKFQWRDKEGAAHPGEEGLLRWSPSL